MILKNVLKILDKNSKILIVLIWLFSTLLYIKLFGLVTNMEAIKYIDEARLFIEKGTFSVPRYWFYSITIFIITVALKLKIGLTGAFILQAILNLYAYLFFYTALKKAFQLPLTAFFIIAYLLIFWPYQNWVVYLFTESAFFSLILILFSTLILYKPESFKNILLICIALVLVIMSRPLGILFGGSIYLYLFYSANKKWKIVLGCASLFFLAFFFYTANTIFSTTKYWTITQAFEQESVICDLPTTTPSFTKLDLAISGNPVYQLCYYLTHNFSHFLHLAGIKLQYFFLMTRPFYSKAHNYFLLLNTIPLYLLMIGSFFIKRIPFNKEVALFLISSIALYTIIIIIQCDDYQNRFILSIYPFFVVLAARTIEYLILHFFKNYKQTARIDIEKPVL